MKKNKFAPSFAFLAVLIWIAGTVACSSGRKTVKTAPSASGAGSKSVVPAAKGETPPSAPARRPEGRVPAIEKDDLSSDEGLEKNGNGDKGEAAALLEEALSTTQEAQAAIEKGETESALSKLDAAYDLLLRAQTPPDQDLCQEKNDLRLLIAQRIQQLYASHLKPAGNGNGTIPLVENKWVLDEIRSFQTRERKYFLDAYQRSGLYRTMIVEELVKAGLPEQLAWVPIIESGFKPRALSRARALGMWQFIRSTGYRFGLKQDKYVDERMDPIKATRAAVKYLSELHDFFGDWTTALASYNCGELRVQNVIKAQKIDYLDNFWDLFNNLPYETARFVPRIVAVALIVENPEKYGFTLPTPEPPLAFETISIGQPVKLATLASNLGLDPLILTFLNPELRHDSTPDYDYSLRVPPGSGEKALAALPTLPRYIPPDSIYGWHSVRSGDTLGAIARRYRTTAEAIMRLNGIRNPKTLRIGQKLKIPGKGDPAEPEPGTTAGPRSVAPGPTASATPAAPAATNVTYVVKNGDTLFTLAKLFSTTIAKIKTDNRLDGDDLSVGQKLFIRKS
jgi:membrane-bound lytic murein transglycosylase D